LPAAGFELTEHTADVGVHAWGSSLEAVFEQAALAMLSLVYARDAVEERHEYSLRVEAADAELLLAAWLNELLYQVDGLHRLPARFPALAVSPPADERDPEAVWRLRATVAGERLDPARHLLTPVVKAATLYALSVRRTGEGWEGRVVLDV
jgi:SHS2 domain-containing protein